MAGFWTGLVHGTLLCGATLAALSLAFPRATPAPEPRDTAPAGPPAVNLPTEAPAETLPLAPARDALPETLVEDSMAMAPAGGEGETVAADTAPGDDVRTVEAVPGAVAAGPDAEAGLEIPPDVSEGPLAEGASTNGNTAPESAAATELGAAPIPPADAEATLDAGEAGATDPAAAPEVPDATSSAAPQAPARQAPIAELRDPVGSEFLRSADRPPVAPAASLAPTPAPLPRRGSGDGEGIEPRPAPAAPGERPAEAAAPQGPALLAETADPEPPAPQPPLDSPASPPGRLAAPAPEPDPLPVPAAPADGDVAGQDAAESAAEPGAVSGLPPERTDMDAADDMSQPEPAEPGAAAGDSAKEAVPRTQAEDTIADRNSIASPSGTEMPAAAFDTGPDANLASDEKLPEAMESDAAPADDAAAGAVAPALDADTATSVQPEADIETVTGLESRTYPGTDMPAASSDAVADLAAPAAESGAAAGSPEQGDGEARGAGTPPLASTPATAQTATSSRRAPRPAPDLALPRLSLPGLGGASGPDPQTPLSEVTP